MATVTKRATRLLSTKRLRIGVNPGGSQAGEYQELPGAQSMSHEVGARSVEQVDFFGATAAETGSRTVEPFNVGFGNDLSHMRVMRGLQEADEAGRPVDIRVEVYGYVIEPRAANAAAGSVAVAAPAAGMEHKGGLVTFGGTNAAAIQRAFLRNRIQPGDIIWAASATAASAIDHDTDIETAGDAFIINRVEFDDAAPTNVANLRVYVTAIDGSDAAVEAATVADFLVAGYRREFDADVEQQGSFSGDASGSPSLDTTMTFRPKTLVPPREIILFDQANSGW